MDMSVITEVIMNLGIPAALVAWLMFDSYKSDERYAELMGSFKDAIHSNTLALELLKSELKHKKEYEQMSFDDLDRENKVGGK